MSSSKKADHFDLLPYIAVLMCTLGGLLLITLSMTAINLGPGAGVGLVPIIDTNRPTKMPVLIEWDGEYATVHDSERDTREPVRIEFRTGFWGLALGNETDTQRLERVLGDLESKTNTHYALFAVRPSGFDNFDVVRILFDNRDISVGYEPIEQGKPIKLKKAVQAADIPKS